MCDTCAICEGHKDQEKYLQIWQRMRNPPLSYDPPTTNVGDRTHGGSGKGMGVGGFGWSRRGGGRAGHSAGTTRLEGEMRNERVFESMQQMRENEKKTLGPR